MIADYQEHSLTISGNFDSSVNLKSGRRCDPPRAEGCAQSSTNLLGKTAAFATPRGNQDFGHFPNSLEPARRVYFAAYCNERFGESLAAKDLSANQGIAPLVARAPSNNSHGRDKCQGDLTQQFVHEMARAALEDVQPTRLLRLLRAT
jgi:hypothetical protein